MTQTILKIVGVLALIGLVLGGTYAITTLGPKRVENREIANLSQDSEEKAVALMERSRQLELEFLAFSSDREPTEEELDTLKEAIDLIEEARSLSINYDGATIARREELRLLYENGMAVILVNQSREEEERALELEKQGELPRARYAYRRAYNFQLQANSNYPLSEYVDVGRATRLSRKVTSVEVEPLYQDSVAKEEAARDAFQTEDWITARNALRDAIALQRRINQEFRGTQRANLTRLARLQELEVTYRSAQAYSQVEKRISDAEDLFRTGEWVDAARLYEDARRRQREINEVFPDSEFASSQRVLELEGRRQTALSRPLYEEIIVGVDLIDSALRDRDPGRAERTLQTVADTLEQVRTDFPRQEHKLDNVELKVAYLNVNRGRLIDVQGWISDYTQSLAGRAGVRLAAREVDQRLYMWVMGNNPSPFFGQDLPVSRVTFSDAEAFCRRLSWMLGQTVRLPTLAEYRLALGEISLAEITAQLGEGDGGEEPRSALGRTSNEYGFIDLLGNVAEWLSAEQVFGGDATFTAEQLNTVPVVDVEKDTRSPLIGLRFLVEAP